MEYAEISPPQSAPGPAAESHDALVGRQAIYDRQLEVAGYELLFRGQRAVQASASDDDEATAEVVVNTFLEIGLDFLAGEKPVFLNATRKLLLEEHLLALPAERVVLEVLEDSVVDDALVSALGALFSRGYRIALDDVTHPKQVERLIHVASIIKVDVLAIDRAMLADLAALRKRHNVTLLAEKVETHEMLAACQELGFELFQGFFLCRPATVGVKRGPSNRLAMVRLLAEIHRPDIQFHKLEDLLKHDPSLSYKLLRLSNSALVGGYPIASIGQALRRIGIEKIANWATILLLSQAGDKPHDLINLALLRGFMCEDLARRSAQPHKESYFLAGMLSVMDALFDRPMAEILETLPLDEHIRHALLQKEGALGAALGCAIAYERGDFGHSVCFGLPPGEIAGAYLNALRQTKAIRDSLTDAGPTSNRE